jgi:hypothetical protein
MGMVGSINAVDDTFTTYMNAALAIGSSGSGEPPVHCIPSLK